MGKIKSNKKFLNYFLVGMIIISTVLSVLTPTNQVFANEENILTKTVSFPYSAQRNRTQKITLPNISKINSVTTDNGNVTHILNGEELTVNVSNGIGKEFQTGGTYTPAESKYVEGHTSANYNVGGFSGTLTQYLYSGSYTPADTKYIEGYDSPNYNKDGYLGTLTKYVYSGTYIPGGLKLVDSGSIQQYFEAQTPTLYTSYMIQGNWFIGQGTPINVPLGYLSVGKPYYSIFLNNTRMTKMVLTKIETPQNGNGVWYDYYDYVVGQEVDTRVYKYRGNVTKPAQDTRVYRYRGTVTKPAQDTRTWETRYTYNVTIKYSEAPNAPIINLDVSESTWVNRDVYFAIDDNKASGQTNLRVEYSLSGATEREWRTYFEPVVISNEGITTIHARVIDSNGYTSKISKRIVKIDKSKSDSEYKLNPSTWTNQDVNISINATDSLSGVKRIKLPDGNWINANNVTYKTSTNGVKPFEIEDNAGNLTFSEVIVKNIDKEKPRPPSIDLNGISDDWVNKDIIATITANGDDGGSGYHIEYSLSGAITEEWRTYINPVHNETDGITTIYARVVDNAGNVSSVISKTMKIDRNAPELTITPNIKLLTNTDVILNVKAFDSDSGVKRIQLPNGNWVNSDELNYTVSENGTYTFKAEDNFGHISSVDFIVKNIKRDVLITPIPEVDLELLAEDKLSGISEMRFKNEDESWSSWESYKSYKEWELEPVNGLKHVWVQYRDKVGNVTKPIEDIIILDMTKPIASFLEINEGATYTKTKSVTLDIKGSDDYTGVEDIYLSNDNETWVKYPYTERVEDWLLSDGDGMKTVYLKISDKAGNISDVITDTIFLDTTKPFANISINNGDSFTPTRDVMLTLTYSDVGGSGVDKVKVIEGDREYTLPAPTPDSPIIIPWTLDFGVVRTVSIVVTDKAGNVSNIVSDTIIVDKLTIKQFTLENVVNPLVYNKNNPFQEKVWAFEPQKMIAGGDITFSMDIKQAVDAEVVNDSINYKVEVVGDDYHKAFTGDMRKARDHYTQMITIPKDTPNGAKVYVTATAKRVLNVSPYDTQIVYFPGGEDASQKALIGVVEGNIYEAIRFNETQ